MDLNFFILAISSLIAFFLLLRHMISYRGRRVALYFISFGLIFGFLRSTIINFIQVTINHSYTPYAFKDSLLKVGSDSLQVYLGWIITAYLAWCFSEYFLEALTGKYHRYKDLEKSIFPLLCVSFVFIAAFSYMIETTASFMKWWSWNTFLTAGFTNSLFVNVPWVGIVDWASVSFEYLGIFFLVRYSFFKRKLWPLLIFILPGYHWLSHINLTTFKINIFGNILTLAVICHLLMIVVALCMFWVRGPKIDNALSLKKSPHLNTTKLIWGAFYIIFGLCLLCDIFWGKNWQLLISLIPISIIYLIATKKIKTELLYKTSIISFLSIMFLPLDFLIKKRIVMSFFPLFFLAMILIVEKYNTNIIFSKIKKQANKKFLFKTGLALVLIVLIFTGFKLSNIHIGGRSSQANHLDSKHKKVILITLDTVRDDHLSFNGYSRNTTPNIDQFSRESTLFENSHTTIPYTVPSHYSILTGKFPKNTEMTMNSSRQNNEDVSLAELFKNKDYKTAAFVSANVLNQNNFFKKGFDTFDFEIGQRSAKGNKITDPLARLMERSAIETNEKVFPWLEKNSDSDFFLWIHYYDAHSPYNSYCEADTYSKGLQPDTKDFLNGTLVGNVGPNTEKTPNNFTDKDMEYLKARYDEEILCMDQQLGKLFQELKKSGSYEDATIILVSDHGENFDHDSLFHGKNVYESATKVPMIIKSPLITKGKINNPVLLSDIFQTLVDKFDLESTQNDSVDLEKSTPDRKIFLQTTFGEVIDPKTLSNEDRENPMGRFSKLAIIDGQKKLVTNNKFGDPELYDLASDKNELNNLALKNPIELKNINEELKNFFIGSQTTHQ